jgi:hypothetical protein
MNSSTVAGILERARASLGYEALRTLEGQLVLSGASERYGLAGRATLTLSPTGEFVDSFAGRVGMTVAFDGSAGWGLDMTAMPMGLDLDELETPRIVCGVLSGLWLREDGPFDVELDRAKTDEQTVGLKLSLRGGTVGHRCISIAPRGDRRAWSGRSSDGSGAGTSRITGPRGA